MFLMFPLFLAAQIARFDDFSGAESWWQFHRDGTAADDSESLKIENGYLVLKLANPSSHCECNVGISDPQNIYGKNIDYLSFEARIKILTPMKPGSRGWGFWKAAKGGRASSLAWFMQQFDAQYSAFSWSRMGVISRRKAAFRDLNLQQNEWHVYGVERDLTAKTTRFFIDGEQVYSTPGLAPAERMSFHLWVDNQVYSRKKGVLRQQWAGLSSLLVDYVKIEDKRPAPFIDNLPEPVVFFERLHLFQQSKPRSYHFEANGDTVYVLAAARAEYNHPFAVSDELTLNWNGSRAVWSGDSLRGASKCVLLKSAIKQNSQTLDLFVRETPVLSYLAALSYPELHLLMDLKGNVLNAATSSTFEFNTRHKKLLLCLALNKAVIPRDISLTLDGQNFNDELRRQLANDDVPGISRLLFVKTDLQQGKHRLQLPPHSSQWLERVILFFRP